MAVYPIDATPYPSGTNPATEYSGTFIPTIWSGKMIEKFYDATVLAAIANTDYEGEVRSFGDTVKIRQKPDVTIKTYEAGGTLDVERPSAATVDLTIDQGKYFNTILDDVMEVQADMDMLSMWADDASERMKIEIDTDVLGVIPAGAVAENQGLTAGAKSAAIVLGTDAAPLLTVSRAPEVGQTEIIDVITRLGQTLDEQNIPETGRWLVIPAWFSACIKRSELRDASLVGDGVSMLRNGRLGMIERFTVYMSNLTGNAGTTGNDLIYAGHNHGLTFASQLTKLETLRGESSFGTFLRGLQVYGRAVTDGKALAVAVCQKV